MFLVINKLRPCTTLHPNHPSGILRTNPGYAIRFKKLSLNHLLIADSAFRSSGNRTNAIHFLYGRISGHCPWLRIRSSLIPIEIKCGTRCKNNLISLVRRIRRKLLPPIRDNRRSRLQLILWYFIPTYHHFSFRRKKGFHSPNHVTLQFIPIFYPFLRHQSPAFRTIFPFYFAGFITANMNISRRKKVDNFRQDIFHKSIGLLITGTKLSTGIRFAHAAKFRITDKHFIRMSRKLNFRNYLNTSFFRISHYLPYIFFCIITSISVGGSFR